MGPQHLPHQIVVWVTVEQVQQRQTRWTYRLSKDKPCSLISSPHAQPVEDQVMAIRTRPRIL